MLEYYSYLDHLQYDGMDMQNRSDCEDYYHKSEVPDPDCCRDYITDLVQAIYISGDIRVMMDSLEILADSYDVKIPNIRAQIYVAIPNIVEKINVA